MKLITQFKEIKAANLKKYTSRYNQAKSIYYYDRKNGITWPWLDWD